MGYWVVGHWVVGCRSPGGRVWGYWVTGCGSPKMGEIKSGCWGGGGGRRVKAGYCHWVTGCRSPRGETDSGGWAVTELWGVIILTG